MFPKTILEAQLSLTAMKNKKARKIFIVYISIFRSRSSMESSEDESLEHENQRRKREIKEGFKEKYSNPPGEKIACKGCLLLFYNIKVDGFCHNCYKIYEAVE